MQQVIGITKQLPLRHIKSLLGLVAQSDVCPTGNQEAAGSMLWCGTIFPLRLITIILSLPLIQKAICQLLAKEWALSID